MNTVIWSVVIFIFLLDQFSKFFASRNLNPGESIAVIKNIFYLTLVHNSGAAFGIFRDQTIFFTVISILVAVSIGIYINKRPKAFFLKDFALALILGGAIGNLVDRLRFGYVVDFLDFRIWPVFNIADSAVTIGVFLLVISVGTGVSVRKYPHRNTCPHTRHRCSAD